MKKSKLQILAILLAIFMCVFAWGERVLAESSPLGYDERSNPKELFDTKDLNERCKWYREKLGGYINTIMKAARKENIPPQLLMTVILAELSDIGNHDVLGDNAIDRTNGSYDDFKASQKWGMVKAGEWKAGRPFSDWSFGIAQIQPRKAIKYKAIEVPKYIKTKEHSEFYVAYKLLDRHTSIFAAAKVIKEILRNVEKYQNYPWARNWIAVGRRFSAQRPYAALLPTVPAGLRPDNVLSILVVAEYNSDGILRDRRAPTMAQMRNGNSGGYPNALKQANWASRIATDLYKSKACGFKIHKVRKIEKDKKEVTYKVELIRKSSGCRGYSNWYIYRITLNNPSDKQIRVAGSDWVNLGCSEKDVNRTGVGLYEVIGPRSTKTVFFESPPLKLSVFVDGLDGRDVGMKIDSPIVFPGPER